MSCRAVPTRCWGGRLRSAKGGLSCVALSRISSEEPADECCEFFESRMKSPYLGLSKVGHNDKLEKIAQEYEKLRAAYSFIYFAE